MKKELKYCIEKKLGDEKIKRKTLFGMATKGGQIIWLFLMSCNDLEDSFF